MIDNILLKVVIFIYASAIFAAVTVIYYIILALLDKVIEDEFDFFVPFGTVIYFAVLLLAGVTVTYNLLMKLGGL